MDIILVILGEGQTLPWLTVTFIRQLSIQQNGLNITTVNEGLYSDEVSKATALSQLG